MKMSFLYTHNLLVKEFTNEFIVGAMIRTFFVNFHDIFQAMFANCLVSRRTRQVLTNKTAAYRIFSTDRLCDTEIFSEWFKANTFWGHVSDIFLCVNFTRSFSLAETTSKSSESSGFHETKISTQCRTTYVCACVL